MIFAAEAAVGVLALLALLLVARAVQDGRAVVVVAPAAVSVVVQLSVSVLLAPVERVSEIAMAIVEGIERGGGRLEPRRKAENRNSLINCLPKFLWRREKDKTFA